MSLIYSLPENDYNITIYDECVSFQKAKLQMENIAVSFVKKENGDKRAQDAFKYSVDELDKYDTPDGYHLIRDADSIIVYLKSTEMISGTFFGVSPQINVRKIRRYAISDLPPRQATISSIIKEDIPKEKEHGAHVSYIGELKDFLKKYKSPDVNMIEQKIIKRKLD